MHTGEKKWYRWRLLVCTALFLFFSTGLACGQDGEPLSAVVLISPVADSEVVARRPEISCRINLPFHRDYLYVYLDGVDLSGLADVSENGFRLKPVAPLAAGNHALVVMFYGQDGREVYQEFSFTSRHSQAFDELSSTNEITARYQAVLDKPSDTPHIPYSAIDANIATSSRLKKGAWLVSLDGNIRYVDQNMAVAQPLYKGANVNNYTAKLERNNQKGGYHLLAEVGDVQVNESATTVQNMARRGGKITVDYKDVALSGFVVNSTPVYGFRSDDDGFGIDSSDDDHLMGISGKVGFLANRVSLKSLYITGGETGSGFGLFTEQGGSKGHVAGAVLQTDFFNQKLVTEQEFFVSSFDPDTSDTWDSEDDKAYRLGLSGTTAKYYYQAAYEYFGPYYSVAGQYITSDREGFVITTGANFSAQNVMVSVSQHHDNVEDDPLYPIIYTSQGTGTYNYTGITNFPLGLNYSKVIIDSSSEPITSPSYRLDTDLVSASIAYYKDNLNIALQPSYSLQNDRLSDNDTSNRAVALTTNYSLSSVNISSLFSFNRAIYHVSHEETDTYLVNLQLQGRLLDDHVGYGFGGSYSQSDSDTGLKSDILATDFEVAYSFKQGAVAQKVNPSIGVRTTYQKSKDYSNDDENEELVFYLVLSSRVPFSL